MDTLLTISFESGEEFRDWLADNHASSRGIWLRIFKKASGARSVTYDEALDEALCFGWIDGQKKSYDDQAWLQKFTPRGAKSVWSKRNTEHVGRLIEEKKMTPAGLAQVEAAKADGRWAQAYSSPRNATIPDDFLVALKENKEAYEFFQTLDKRNTYAIVFQLQTARRPETYERRKQSIMALLSSRQKLY